MNSIQDFLQLIPGIALLLATPSGRVGVVRRKGESFRRQPKGPIEMTAKITPAARKARTARRTSAAVFSTGVIVSLAANVYASERTPIGIAVGLWVPVAFLLAMAMLENVPATGTKGKLRFAAILFLALVAGWTSYWHLVEVALDGGADQVTAHLLPLTVDVMMALAGPGMKRKPAAPARRKPVAKKAPARKLASVA